MQRIHTVRLATDEQVHARHIALYTIAAASFCIAFAASTNVRRAVGEHIFVVANAAENLAAKAAMWAGLFSGML